MMDLASDGRNRILAHPREAIETLSIDSHKVLETFEFREPYGSSGVQRFGEKRAFRRIISRLCRSRLRRTTKKSLQILGLFANKFTRRTHGFSEAGGARGIRTVGAIYLCLSAPRSQLSHYIAANPAGFMLRLSSCSFHDASTNEILGSNSDSKKPSKTMRFQGLDVWLRGQDLNL